MLCNKKVITRQIKYLSIRIVGRLYQPYRKQENIATVLNQLIREKNN